MGREGAFVDTTFLEKARLENRRFPAFHQWLRPMDANAVIPPFDAVSGRKRLSLARQRLDNTAVHNNPALTTRTQSL